MTPAAPSRPPCRLHDTSPRRTALNVRAHDSQKSARRHLEMAPYIPGRTATTGHVLIQVRKVTTLSQRLENATHEWTPNSFFFLQSSTSPVLILKPKALHYAEISSKPLTRQFKALTLTPCTQDNAPKQTPPTLTLQTQSLLP